MKEMRSNPVTLRLIFTQKCCLLLVTLGCDSARSRSTVVLTYQAQILPPPRLMRPGRWQAQDPGVRLEGSIRQVIGVRVETRVKRGRSSQHWTDKTVPKPGRQQQDINSRTWWSEVPSKSKRLAGAKGGTSVVVPGEMRFLYLRWPPAPSLRPPSAP